MFVIKRNQVIITALVVMIAVAGYLNYTDSKNALNQTGITLNDNGEIEALVPNYLSLAEDDNPLIATNDLEANTNTNTNTNTNNQVVSITDAMEAIPAGSMGNDNKNNENLGEAVFVNSAIDTSFFVQAKLEREQTRAKEKELLKEMINNMNVEQEKRSRFADAMLEIQQRIEKETAAEAMIEAKGFSEVYVRIDDDTVDVVVNKQALTDAEIAQIEDIVKRKTGVSADKIRISTIKR